MRKLAVAVLLAAALGACKKTGEGEYKVQTPDVNVSTDTHTVQTPSVETGTKEDTMIVKTPTVNVKTPEQRRADSIAAATKKP